MINIERALQLAINQLEPYTNTARLDAEILLAFIMTRNRTYLYAHPEAILSTQQLLIFEQLVARRSLGTPVAYLTGMREFWSLPLQVNEETLIPRPETELIVELTLQLMPNQPGMSILDLGTGSGAIALALAKERENWQIVASDYSLGALKTAIDNALKLHLHNISFLESNWFSKINEPERFNAIVSNPPYIAANDPHLEKGDLRFEPSLALVSDNNGLSALEHIIKHSIERLEPDGLLLIEHGYTQKASVMSMLKEYGYTHVQSWQDIHGNDRVSGGKHTKDHNIKKE